MEIGKNRRQRAVRLTHAALLMVQRRLVDDWQSTEADDRLTWSARAALLGVSTNTAKRILGREGNDQAVLIRAFASLGLEWRDEYCEPVNGSIEEQQPGYSTEDPVSHPIPSPPIPATPPRRPKRLLFIASLSLAALTLNGLLAFRLQRGELPYDQRPQAKELAIARVAYHKADYAEASYHAKKAYSLAYDTGDTNALSEAIRFEGEIYAAQGNLDRAVERFRTALTFRTELNAYWGRASVLIALAMVEQKLNRIDEAEAHLHEALEGMRKAGDQAGLAEACRELGSVAATRGDRASARRWFDTAAAAIADRPDEPMHIDIQARKAMLLADEGKHDAALVTLRGCLEQWKGHNHARWVATTLLQIGRVLRAAGREIEARHSFEAARQSFGSVGDKGGVSECNEWLEGSRSNVRRTAQLGTHYTGSSKQAGDSSL